jgi:hypothetical protein
MEWTTTNPESATDWAKFEVTTAPRSLFGAGTAAKTVYIRTAATAAAFESNYATVGIPADTAVPTTVTVDYANETLTGVTTAMEYQKAGASSWTKITGETLNIASLIPAAGKDSIVINVRVKATTAPASAAVEITIPARPATPKAAQVTYDYKEEKLKTALVGAEYVVGKVTDTNLYAAFSSGTAVIPATTASQSVSVRIAASNDDDSFASLPLSVTVAAKPAKPSGLKWDTKKLAVTGFTTLMEYQIGSTDGTWTPATAGLELQSADLENDAADVIVYVRLKATATKPASVAAEINAPAVNP